MKNDPWLDKWLALIQKKSAGGFVLELGCGGGLDTVELLSAGCKVIGMDISRESLAECTKAAPDADIIQTDISKPLPFAKDSASVIIASLSLHYFSWEVTMQISSEIKRCIKDGGLLLTRFNSTNDRYHGSLSTQEIEPNFYCVGTRTKRFFDERSMQLFLEGWDIQFLEENVIHRYEKPKYVWEAMAICN
jgi:SAM-dependent methyltransferase